MALITSGFKKKREEEQEDKLSRRGDVKSMVARALEAGQHAVKPGGGLMEEYKSPAATPQTNFSSAVHTEGGLNPHFESALQKLIAASGGKITINSGYRSPQRQAELYEAALKKYGSEAAARKWVAPPGKSKHNHGLAADLKYADAATKRWAHENARKFGLHFPLSNEDWHIEPVGSR